MVALPPEVLIEIFLYCAPENGNEHARSIAEDISKDDLLALCLTCRQFGTIVQPILFRSIAVVENTQKAANVCHILIANDRLAAYVRSFDVRAIDYIFDLNYARRQRLEAVEFSTAICLPAALAKLTHLETLKLTRLALDDTLYRAVCHVAVSISKLSIMHCRETAQGFDEELKLISQAATLQELELSELDEIYQITFPTAIAAPSLRRLRITGGLVGEAMDVLKTVGNPGITRLEVFDFDTRRAGQLVEFLAMLGSVEHLLVQTYRGGHKEETEDEGEGDHLTANTGPTYTFRGWSLPLVSTLADFIGEAWLCRVLAPGRPIQTVRLQSRVQNSIFGISQSVRMMDVHPRQWSHEVSAAVRAIKALSLSSAPVLRFQCDLVELQGNHLRALLDAAVVCLPKLRNFSLTWIYDGLSPSDLQDILRIYLSRFPDLHRITISHRAFHVGERPSEYVADLAWQYALVLEWHNLCPSLHSVTVSPFVAWKLLNRDWQPVFQQPNLVKRLLVQWANPDQVDGHLTEIAGAMFRGRGPPRVSDYKGYVRRLVVDKMDESMERLLRG